MVSGPRLVVQLVLQGLKSLPRLQSCLYTMVPPAVVLQCRSSTLQHRFVLPPIAAVHPRERTPISKLYVRL